MLVLSERIVSDLENGVGSGWKKIWLCMSILGCWCYEIRKLDL